MAFIDPPAPDAAAQRLYDAEVAEIGYVMNASRLWAHQPASSEALFALMNAAVAPLDLDRRRRGILVAACAATLGDSYCSLAWGTRLAVAADDDTLGARPDAELRTAAPAAVREAVAFGRRIAEAAP